MKELNVSLNEVEQVILSTIINNDFYRFREYCLLYSYDAFEIMRKLNIEGQYEEEDNDAFIAEYFNDLVEEKLPLHWDDD